jgi:hypothetical protein
MNSWAAVALALMVAVWPPPPRAPLPPFPTPTGQELRRTGVWSFSPYDSTLPFDPPDNPDRDFHRGNFSGVRAPECGLRQLKSGSAGHPEHTMSWDQPQYDAREQDCILRAHQARGYTHFLTSIPQARKHAGALDGLTEATARIKTAGMWSVVVAFGGDGETWARDVKPRLDTLKARGAVDEVVVCWQCDKAYPNPWHLLERTMEVSKWAKANGAKVSVHWITHAAALWSTRDKPRPNTCLDAARLGLPPICTRFDYHRATSGIVDYQYLQQDVYAPIADSRPGKGGLQGEIGDVLASLTTQKLVVAEYDAQREFDDPATATEDEGDLKGWLLLSSRRGDRVVRGGFMGGARAPDGSVVR